MRTRAGGRKARAVRRAGRTASLLLLACAAPRPDAKSDTGAGGVGGAPAAIATRRDSVVSAPASGRGTPPPAPAAGETGAPAVGAGGVSAPSTGQRGRGEPAPPPLPVLTAVRTALRGESGTERVVFEFDRGPLPEYELETGTEGATQCGSGEAVALEGTARLHVRFRGAQAHRQVAPERSSSTIARRDRRTRYPLLRQLVQVCDFEGVVEWVLGLASPVRPRAFALRDPTRLVVDLADSSSALRQR